MTKIRIYTKPKFAKDSIPILVILQLFQLLLFRYLIKVVAISLRGDWEVPAVIRESLKVWKWKLYICPKYWKIWNWLTFRSGYYWNEHFIVFKLLIRFVKLLFHDARFNVRIFIVEHFENHISLVFSGWRLFWNNILRTSHFGNFFTFPISKYCLFPSKNWLTAQWS